MIPIEPIKYQYAMNLKLSYIGNATLVSEVSPNVEDMIINSKKFDTAKEAIASANALVAEVMQTLCTVSSKVFSTTTEINPKFSGKSALSKEWHQHEIAKLWIFDKQQKTPGPTVAIALVQLVESPEQEVLPN